MSVQTEDDWKRALVEDLEVLFSGGEPRRSEEDALALVSRWETEGGAWGRVWGPQVRGQVRDEYRARRLAGRG